MVNEKEERLTPLRMAREHLNMTQERLAKLADVDQTTISRAESSKRLSVSLARKVEPHLAGLVTELQLVYPEKFPFVLPAAAAKDKSEAAA